MSDTVSTHLALPFLLPAQAQKHVTHNEALQILDNLVQLSVLDRDLAAPPAGAAEGDRYIVAAGGTGEWDGWDGSVACLAGNGWLQIVPQAGWRTWVVDEGRLVFFDGTDWVGTSSTAQQDVSLFGLGTTADTTAPFAARLNAALWTARETDAGGDGDLRLTLNKETTADVLSLVFQTGYAARAEIGLPGSDDLTLKVSPDGETWIDAMVIERATGTVRAGVLSVGTDADAADGMLAVFGRSAAVSLQLHQGGGRIHLVPHPAGDADWTAALGYDSATGSWHIGDATGDASRVLTQGDADAAAYAHTKASEIGSLSFMKNLSGSFVNVGQNLAGANLAYSDVRSTGIAQHTIPVSGTWRALAPCAADTATVFARIA